MKTFFASSSTFLLVAVASPAAATFQVQTGLQRFAVKQTNSNVWMPRSFERKRCSALKAMLENDLDSADAFLAAGRSLDEATRKISEYSAMLEGGSSNIKLDGLVDGLSMSLPPGFESSVDKLAVPSEQLEKLRGDLADLAVMDPESFNKMKEAWLNSLSEQLQKNGVYASTKQSILEFSQWYFTALDEKYHWKDLQQSLSDGTAFSNFMQQILTAGKTSLASLQWERDGPLLLFIATFFIFTAGRQSAEEIKAAKRSAPASVSTPVVEGMGPEEKINALERELSETKSSARKEMEEKSAEIAAMRSQMDELQTQVVALTEAAQALTKQLEQNSNAVSETVSTNHLNAVNGISGESEVTTSDPEPIIAETSTELGKTKNEFSKNVKGAHSAKASTSPGTNRKTNSNKTEQKPEDVGANHLNAVNNIIGESEVTMSDPESFVAETPKELGKMENKSTKKVKVAHFAKASTSLGMKRKITTEKSEQKSEKLRPQKTLVVSKSDWKSLSESTLKRKTVKELTGYLSDKGVDVTGDDGKTLKKNNLVELVLSTK